MKELSQRFQRRPGAIRSRLKKLENADRGKQPGSTTTFERAQPYLAEVSRIYYVQSPNEVRRFLAAHDFLVLFLIEAIEPLRQYFSGHALSLSVQTDPDTRTKNLLLSIDIQDDPDQVMQRLDQMDAEWWFNIPPKIRDLVLVTLSATE